MPQAIDTDLLREVEQFLYLEARLADEHRYEEWEALWAQEAIYWVPAGGDDVDPGSQMSVIYDNRARITTRVRQLRSGKRHAQAPPSRIRHLLANVELLEADEQRLEAAANVLVYESRARGVTLWAARSEWTLVRTAEGLRIARKKVSLCNNDRPLPTLAFLI